MHEVLNIIWKNNQYPEEWCSGVIMPIYKKGDRGDVKNYRGIALMDSSSKIYTSIIREKLIKKSQSRMCIMKHKWVFVKAEVLLMLSIF